MPQVGLDRLPGDEEPLGDFGVGEAGGRELGDATLARRQRFDPAEHDPAGPCTGGGELGLGRLHQRRSSASVREVKRGAEVITGGGSLVRASQPGAEREPGMRELEPAAGGRQHADRVGKQAVPVGSACHGARGAQRHAERPWRPERSGPCERGPDQRDRLPRPSRHRERRGDARPPRIDRRVAPAALLEQSPRLHELVDPVVDLALGERQLAEEDRRDRR